jgi:hypothetical protein
LYAVGDSIIKRGGFAEYRPQSQCEKALFFPISRREIPNSVVIKLFVKIVSESFFKRN